jgi:LytS/YehU family sensor histidine kinase
LYDNTKERIELKKEVENLRNYIELEKIRNQDSVVVNYEFTENLNGERIAPMLLLPLVENAFKHGNTSATKTSFINCSLGLQEHLLHFHCANSFQNNVAARENHGIGLYNVKRRLELLYPNRHELNIVQSGSIYQLNLTINLNEN